MFISAMKIILMAKFFLSSQQASHEICELATRERTARAKLSFTEFSICRFETISSIIRKF